MESITTVEEVPEGGTFVFRIRDGADASVDEAILTRVDGELNAWINRCQHWTDVRIDDGEGATVRNGEIVCEKHGAYFETDTGYCNYGPCEGSRLPGVEVKERDGDVYLDDDGYELVGVGSLEGDGDDGAPKATRGGDDFEL